MSRVLILVGTETGNAEYIATELATALEFEELESSIVDMFDATPALVREHDQVIVCTSTHGDGDLPGNAERFYAALQREQPDLSHVRFTVCALGDHLYDPYFCEAGKTFESLFGRLGATNVIERFEIDGEPDTEQIEGAMSWALDVAAAFGSVPA
jgi:MioC protein